MLRKFKATIALFLVLFTVSSIITYGVGTNTIYPPEAAYPVCSNSSSPLGGVFAGEVRLMGYPATWRAHNSCAGVEIFWWSILINVLFWLVVAYLLISTLSFYKSIARSLRWHVVLIWLYSLVFFALRWLLIVSGNVQYPSALFLDKVVAELVFAIPILLYVAIFWWRKRR